jgi:drug/metabolite transporter (DMT)-like permease
MLVGRLVLCVAIALLGALAFAVATVAQHRAAGRSSDEAARGRHFLRQLLGRPQWWAGTLGNGGGYVLQATALGFGPLLVVAPIMVTSLLFALPLGARLTQRPLPRSAWKWGVVLVASLAVFLVLGHPTRGASRATPGGWLLAAGIALPVIVGCILVANSRSGRSRPTLLAVVVGVLAGVLAVLTKSVVNAIPLGVGHLLATPETYALVVVGLAGVYIQQLAFQAGELRASLPVMTVLEPMVGACLGVTMLHEQLDVTGLGIAGLAVATIAMTLATIGLARGEATVVPSLAETAAPRSPVRGPQASLAQP